MTADALHLRIGSTLQLQPLGAVNAPRDVVHLIGYLPSRSLIVSTPSRSGRARIVAPGRRYAVRLLSGSWVQGFVSTVLQSYARPYPHLHLSYPEEFERIPVRNARRAPGCIPCEFRRLNDGGEHRHRGALLDLSTTGARLGLDEPVLRPGEPVEIRFDLEVAGRTERLDLRGTVRNTGEHPVPGEPDHDRLPERPARFAGVSFAELERFPEVLLHAWVLERATEPFPAC